MAAKAALIEGGVEGGDEGGFEDGFEDGFEGDRGEGDSGGGRTKAAVA